MAKANLLPGEQVIYKTCFVYRNLTRGCYSLKDVKTRKVIAHASEVSLVGGVAFKVSAKIRDRVRREKKKYVHAGIVGKVCHFVPIDDVIYPGTHYDRSREDSARRGLAFAYGSGWTNVLDECETAIVYNPHINEGFVEWSPFGEPSNTKVFTSAKSAFLGRRVRAHNPH